MMRRPEKSNPRTKLGFSVFATALLAVVIMSFPFKVIAQTNEPPVADPNGPYTGVVGQPVQFDGSGSFDPVGTIVSYLWDFGDGNTGTGVSGNATPSHTYGIADIYTVSLTVTDDNGGNNTATTTATITD